MSNKLKNFMRDFLLGMGRHALTTAGGSAVTAGYITGEQNQAVTGALTVTLGLILSALDKAKK